MLLFLLFYLDVVVSFVVLDLGGWLLGRFVVGGLFEYFDLPGVSGFV